MKSLRVLVLLDPEFMPPDSIKGLSEQELYKFKTEYDVIKALRSSRHDVRPLGVRDELKPIREEVESFKPDVVFNLLEAFHGETAYDHNVAAYLELVRVPYTGCNPRGMILAGGKDLSKKLLTYHRIPMPKFAVFPMGRKAKKPPHLEYPLIVKSASEDGSFRYFAGARWCNSDDKLAERVTFIHERIGTAAMVEQYIDGRELYVGVLGNDRLRTLPIWELEIQQSVAACQPNRDQPREARSEVSGTARHFAGTGGRSVAGTGQAHLDAGQAHPPQPASRWLFAHRLPSVGRQHSVFPGSQSES